MLAIRNKNFSTILYTQRQNYHLIVLDLDDKIWGLGGMPSDI